MNEGTGPVAGRLRRPTWRDPRLLVGLLLVTLAIVAVALVVRGADKTTPYYAAKEALAPGTVLTEADVVVVAARIAGDAYVEAEQEPWGMIVTRVVAPGELLPAAAITDSRSFDGRPVAVRPALPLAAAVTRGAVVDVYITVEDDSGRHSSRLIGESLVVDDVTADESGFGIGTGETVYVVVPAPKIADFLEAIATGGDISVVGLASGGLT